MSSTIRMLPWPDALDLIPFPLPFPMPFPMPFPVPFPVPFLVLTSP